MILASLIAHALLLIYVQAQKPARPHRALVAVAGSAVLAALPALLISSQLGAQTAIWSCCLSALLIVAYGALVIGDVNQRRTRALADRRRALVGGADRAACCSAIRTTSAADWLVNIFTAPSAC